LQDKAWTRFTFNIRALQNPPSPNVCLSKGYRIGDIKASAHASHKTHACISLKQRGYSRNYGLVCNLGKQMAVLSVLRDRASDYHNLFLLLTNFYNKPLIRFQLIHAIKRVTKSSYSSY
jgi:hypothetical protein